MDRNTEIKRGVWVWYMSNNTKCEGLTIEKAKGPVVGVVFFKKDGKDVKDIKDARPWEVTVDKEMLNFVD